MTKNDIVAEVARLMGRHHTDVKPVVHLAINAIIETLVREGRLEIRGFGVLTVKNRRARKARNPKNEAVVQVPDRKVVSFKCGKFMKERVNGLAPPADLSPWLGGQVPGQTAASLGATGEGPAEPGRPWALDAPEGGPEDAAPPSPPDLETDGLSAAGLPERTGFRLSETPEALGFPAPAWTGAGTGGQDG